MRISRYVVATMVVVVASCSTDAAQAPQEPAQEPTQQAAVGCGELADELAEVLVGLVDAMALEQPESLEAMDEAAAPEGFQLSDMGGSLQELIGALAAGSPRVDLEERATRVSEEYEQHGCTDDALAQARLQEHLGEAVLQRGARMDPDSAHPTPTDEVAQLSPGQAYLAANVLAIAVLQLEPVETYDVPEGFPPELPVHPDAELVSHTTDGEEAEAHWRVAGDVGFESVRTFYSDRLQTGPGRWSSSGATGSVTMGADDEVHSGRDEMRVSGYGHEGTVVVEVVDEHIDVRVTLVPQG